MTIDLYVLMTPVLLLGVVALLQFVGCDKLWNIPHYIHAPKFDPMPGTYDSAQSVTLSSADSDATIFFTTDGTVPTDHSQMFMGQAIPVASTTTINAIAKLDSDVSGAVSGQYIITSSAIDYVQANSATPGPTPVASVSVPYVAVQVPGNLNVVVVGWGDSSSDVASVSDNLGSAYQPAVGPTRVGGLSQRIYFAQVMQGGLNTVTVSFAPAVPYPDVRILEYRGVSQMDASAANVGNGLAAACGPVATSAPAELIFAACTVSTKASGPGTDFVQRVITDDGNLAEDHVVSAIGNYSAGAQLESPGDWVMQMVAFK